MDQTARATVLKSSAFFGGLSDDAIAAISFAANDRQIPKDAALFQQGDPPFHHYLVAGGRLRLDQTTADGKNVVLRYMESGDLVGSVAVFRNKPYPATPIAVEDSCVLSWTTERMSELTKAYPAIAANIVEMIGGRIEELHERLQEISTQQVERRIAAAILRIAAQSGHRTESGVEIPFPLSRQDLAELTGTTLHTVSRTLSAWMKDGILEGRRSSHLVIIQPHRLVKIADQA